MNIKLYSINQLFFIQNRDIATNTWQELNDESIEIVYEISGTDLPEMDPSTSNLLLYKKRKD